MASSSPEKNVEINRGTGRQRDQTTVDPSVGSVCLQMCHPNVNGVSEAACMLALKFRELHGTRCSTCFANQGRIDTPCRIARNTHWMPQTEFAFLRESVAVSRINHILRAHGNPSRTASCRNLRRGWTAVSRKALPGCFGGQYDVSYTQRRPVRNRLQESARHRGSSTPGSTHSSHTAHPSNDPGWSHSWSSADAAFGNSP